MLVCPCGAIVVVLLSADGKSRDVVFHLGEEGADAQIVLAEVLFGGFMLVRVDFNEVACASREDSASD